MVAFPNYEYTSDPLNGKKRNKLLVIKGKPNKIFMARGHAGELVSMGHLDTHSEEHCLKLFKGWIRMQDPFQTHDRAGGCAVRPPKLDLKKVVSDFLDEDDIREYYGG